MPPSKRDDLIDAAMRVFCRNGFHSSGLSAVLQEGGISRMTLYNHFKSKDELVVAALRRRDEIFRNRMMKFVEAKSDDPVQRLLAVFEYHEQWMNDRDFSGCMFINASAEFSDAQCAARRVAADHKRDVITYLCSLCKACGFTQPMETAEQLSLLLDGAIVSAHVVGQVQDGGGASTGNAARLAKRMAEKIILAS